MSSSLLHSWALLRDHLVPSALDRNRTTEPVRGCAVDRWEDALALALAFGDVIGLDDLPDRLVLFATEPRDARSEGIQLRLVDLATIPAELRARSFTRQGRWFIPDTRLTTTIVLDPPEGTFDVVATSRLPDDPGDQERLVARLAPHGQLVVREPPPLVPPILAPVVATRQLLRRSPTPPAVAVTEPAVAGGHPYHGDAPQMAANGAVDLEGLAFLELPWPVLLVSGEGRLLRANRSACDRLEIEPAAIGGSFRALCPSTGWERLWATMSRSMREGRDEQVGFEWPHGSGVRLAAWVRPLPDPFGALVTLSDDTERYQLARQAIENGERLVTAGQELRLADAELRRTSSDLRSVIPELEAARAALEHQQTQLSQAPETADPSAVPLRALARQLVDRLGGAALLDPHFQIHLWATTAADGWRRTAEEMEGRNLVDMAVELGCDVQRVVAARRAVEAGITERVSLGVAVLPDASAELSCEPLGPAAADTGLLLCLARETDRQLTPVAP